MTGAAAMAPAPSGQRLGGWLQRLIFASPLYRLTLKGRVPESLAVKPEDPWPGDPNLARNLRLGRYRFAGEEIDLPDLPPWHPPGAGEAWRRSLHGFDWLRHFAASGSDADAACARALVGSWLVHHVRWDGVAWRPDVVARRLMSWCSHADLLLDNGEPALRRAVLRGIAEQARHLARTASRAPPGVPRLVAAAGLVHAGLCLPGGERWRRRGWRLLEAELATQILADGGHRARSPAVQLAVLQDLVTLREALARGHQDVPVPLQHAIDRMAPMLRCLRHGDGGLALFNGSREQAGLVDMVLARSEARGRAPVSAPLSRFERLGGRRALLLVDVGPPPPAGSGETAAAGLLSFELSVGRERLIVNCGAAERPDGEWARATRATAAHSTLTIADQDAVNLDPDGRLIGELPSVTASRSDAEGSTWLEASHDGWQKRFGLVHRRRLYLDASGDDLRGEDALLGGGPPGTAFAIRFHLHPAVQVSLVQNGVVALLRLPHGAGFRFRVAGGELGLAESVYLGTPGRPRRSEQIVVRGVTEGGETVVKWALTRVQPTGTAAA